MPNDFLESDLENIIYRNRRIISTKGLPPFKSVSFKQVYLPSGRKIDILSFDIIDGKLIMDIYELKRDCIDAAAVCQSYNYLEEVRQLLGSYFINPQINVILIGRKTSMTSHIENTCLPISVYTYDYELNGITFTKVNSSSYRHSEDEYFSKGIAAFGTKHLYYEQDPDSISIHSEYRKYAEDNHSGHNYLSDVMKKWLPQVKIIKEIKKEYVEIEVQPKTIKTVRFPENPCWSKEFEKSIWEQDSEIVDELFLPEVDEDLEPEHLESDGKCDDEISEQQEFSENQTKIVEIDYDIVLSYQINNN